MGRFPNQVPDCSEPCGQLSLVGGQAGPFLNDCRHRTGIEGRELLFLTAGCYENLS